VSYSYSASGSSDDVAQEIESRFKNAPPCTEDEETIRQLARGIISATLAANKPPRSMSVHVTGLQSTYHPGDGSDPRIQNTLSLIIT
jgi:hypothetical protein